jgi:hypothetical protein
LSFFLYHISDTHAYRIIASNKKKAATALINRKQQRALAKTSKPSKKPTTKKKVPKRKEEPYSVNLSQLSQDSHGVRTSSLLLTQENEEIQTSRIISRSKTLEKDRRVADLHNAQAAHSAKKLAQEIEQGESIIAYKNKKKSSVSDNRRKTRSSRTPPQKKWEPIVFDDNGSGGKQVRLCVY